MQLTFQFIFSSFQNLLPIDFYLMPLVFFAFTILVYIVKNLHDLGAGER